MNKMKVAVTGAAGRMGRELIRAVHANDGCVLSGALEHEGSLALGQTWVCLPASASWASLSLTIP